MISRVRIEAKGRDQQEVLDSLNYMTSEVLNKDTDSTHVGDSEFVEEVIASEIADHGAIHYKGRRVLKFDVPNIGPPSSY